MQAIAPILVLLAVVLVACGASQPSPAPEAVAVPSAAPSSVTPPAEPPAEIVDLGRRHDDGDRYRVKTEFALVESPYHPDMGYDVLAEARVEARDGALVLHGEFLSSTLTHGDAVDPLGPSTDVTGARVRFVLDERNRVLERTLEPRTSEHAMAAHEVMEGVEHVRMTYPGRPVAVGESWSRGTVRWDTRPLGWVAVVLEPVFTLEGVEERAGRRWARVRWSGELEVEPFEVMGFAIAARAPVTGVSVIALDDGYSGHHAIHLDVRLTTASGAGSETIARVHIAQQVDRI